jgi:FkbM family methyltransferase
MIFRSTQKRLVRRLARWVCMARRILGLPQKVRFGDFTLELPPEHALPLYQLEHLRYDCFLPYLARALPSGSWVIDVGANCGDTLLAMAAVNRELNFVAYEPDPLFLTYLERNIVQARKTGWKAAVDIHACLVAQEKVSGSLTGNNGTRTVEHSNSAPPLRTERLDGLSSTPGDSRRNCPALIKSDVDGFDFDVILSAGFLLEQAPLLFFECDPNTTWQRGEYEKLFQVLKARGMSSWFVFDNFGSYLFSASQPEAIGDLMSYCMSQKRMPHPTIYYVDVLVCDPERASEMQHLIEGYVRETSGKES